MRFSSIVRRKASRGCGPSLLSVRFAAPPPAVLTAMCSPPSAATASARADSVWSSSRMSTSWNVPPSSLATSAPAVFGRIEDGDLSALLTEQLRRGLGHTRRPADDDGLLPVDLHGGSSLSVSQSGSRSCDAGLASRSAATRENRVYHFAPNRSPGARRNHGTRSHPVRCGGQRGHHHAEPVPTA